MILIFISFIDEDEIYNNPNLHSEEQDELEISDGEYTSKPYKYCFKTSYLPYYYYFLENFKLNWYDIEWEIY